MATASSLVPLSTANADDDIANMLNPTTAAPNNAFISFSCLSKTVTALGALIKISLTQDNINISSALLLDNVATEYTVPQGSYLRRMVRYQHRIDARQILSLQP